MYPRLRLLFLLIISPGFFAIAEAQTAKLTGKIINAKNEPLAGVSVKITGTTGGTTSDVEGRFTLTLTPGKKYELEISTIGYETKIISEVEVTTRQLNELNITLEVKAKTGDNVVVTAKTSTARRETVASAISFQKNTNTVASVISAESIRRSPDKNTGEVIKRTPGASLQEGKFIIVRGLADRYNQAMLNGILLTSTEPDRKTFSFDLIPAPMIDNIVINKAFVPEYPGEWAGGLIQVNTKDIPVKSFLNVQVGLGFNSATTGKDFFREKRGSLDWLGVDDGARALPSAFPTKYNFDTMSIARKTALGKSMDNRWVSEKTTASPNASFQANGGFTSKVFGKSIGGTFGINYTKTSNYFNNPNTLPIPDATTGKFTNEYNFTDNIYDQNSSAGALGSLSIQFNPKHKLSLRSLINVNTLNRVLERNGVNITRTDSILAGSEFTFRQNTFFTGQVAGDHSLSKSLKLKWYGAFSILDGYVPDQRRILYSKANPSDPFRLVISNSLSQQSGSRVYQSLSDYIYTAGGDLSYSFGKGQSVKAGYMFQVKDRLYDARLFSVFLPRDNDALRLLPADKVFTPENFGDGSINGSQFAFDAIKGKTFRYMANTILNAGFLQFDNQIAEKLRIVWGLRVEHFDQLVGSVKVWDERHTYTKVTDYLPGINATYKVNQKTNIRISGSQTVIRPELRELAALNIYDFELNASVQGNPSLKRTKITNLDLRYELYPRAGETFSLGIFYKDFQNAIEAIFEPGIGGASTFNYRNAKNATAFGAELELRKKLDFADALKNFTVQGNFSYIKSKVEDTVLKIDRPLQGQSPYLVNIGVMYDLEKKGFNATMLFNQIGYRIANVGKVEDGFPDIYERGRPVLDLQLAQKVLKRKGELRLNIADLLNQTRYFYMNNSTGDEVYQKSADPSRFRRTFGTTFTLTFNYSIL
ncbi:MAG: TonB-dependent receptor domain-containing protein [Bacteroidota bacterium]